MPNGPVARSVLILVIVAALAAAAWAAPPKLVVKGDAKAWDEIVAAFNELGKLKSYRAKGKMGEQGTLAVEVVNPDRSRTVLTMAGSVAETIVVAAEARYRMGTGPWTCPPRAQVQDPVMRIEKLTGEVTASRGPAAIINGVDTRSYKYTVKEPGPMPSATLRLYVGMKDGLPRRWEMLAEGGKVFIFQEHYDFNRPVTITLPPCK